MIRIETHSESLEEMCHSAIAAATNTNEECMFIYCGVELRARAGDTVLQLMRDFNNKASRCASDIRVSRLEDKFLALVTLCANLVDRVEQLEADR